MSGKGAASGDTMAEATTISEPSRESSNAGGGGGSVGGVGVGVVTRNESVVWDARRNHHGSF